MPSHTVLILPEVRDLYMHAFLSFGKTVVRSLLIDSFLRKQCSIRWNHDNAPLAIYVDMPYVEDAGSWHPVP